ncbi:hypothetical protein EYF80_001560 [Liparis tanakae]|uniref:Uncharacterized protein n=1 Tax=Liparis tanakae TaxID=230148 RepID=A0A4Z2JEU3_9TELE|nr:hypothetical protein EYF80_001560 [Liparis tanakae]
MYIGADEVQFTLGAQCKHVTLGRVSGDVALPPFSTMCLPSEVDSLTGRTFLLPVKICSEEQITSSGANHDQSPGDILDKEGVAVTEMKPILDSLSPCWSKSVKFCALYENSKGGFFFSWLIKLRKLSIPLCSRSITPTVIAIDNLASVGACSALTLWPEKQNELIQSGMSGEEMSGGPRDDRETGNTEVFCPQSKSYNLLRALKPPTKGRVSESVTVMRVQSVLTDEVKGREDKGKPESTGVSLLLRLSAIEKRASLGRSGFISSGAQQPNAEPTEGEQTNGRTVGALG